MAFVLSPFSLTLRSKRRWSISNHSGKRKRPQNIKMSQQAKRKPVFAEAKSFRQLHVHTPLLLSPSLSRGSNRVFLKLDNTQPSGSFKIRGVGHLCTVAAQNGAKRLVSSSGGNAGAAVAYAGRELGIPVTVVVPSTTPVFMLDRLRAQGAQVEVHGNVWDVADKHARKLARDGGLYVSPFDDPLLWCGHSSVIDEIIHDLDEKPAAVVVSVGGGGLFLGVAEGMRRNGWEDVPIVTAETDGADSFARMAKAGKVVRLETIDSIAKSLGALAVSERCVGWVAERKVLPIVVSDRQAVEACSLLAVQHRILVEPACGAAVAALPEAMSKIGKGNVIVIVCGGNMVSPALLKDWAESTGAVESVL